MISTPKINFLTDVVICSAYLQTSRTVKYKTDYWTLERIQCKICAFVWLFWNYHFQL